MDIAISMSYFFDWENYESVDFLLNDNAALCASTKKKECK